ncbi:hypothetical protein [Amaricoccus tamworthensis]|uniref:hypothetical protein n=1 Tax=Amaricoccus tamworthensis TaxID=57002 RepID=UPI003C7D943C
MSGYFTRMAALAVTHPKRPGGSGFRAAVAADIRETTVAAPSAPVEQAAVRPASVAEVPGGRGEPRPVGDAPATVGPAERVAESAPVSVGPELRAERLAVEAAVEKPVAEGRADVGASLAKPEVRDASEAMVETSGAVASPELPRDGVAEPRMVRSKESPRPEVARADAGPAMMDEPHRSVVTAVEERRVEPDSAPAPDVKPVAGKAVAPARVRDEPVRETSVPEVPRPPRRVSVSIGEVSLSVEPPAPAPPKPEPVAPPPRPAAPSRPAAGGIWTGGQGLSRSYVRRL